MDDQDDVNIVEALEARLHIDGPFSDDDTRAAGKVLVHTMRYLCHATQAGRADQSLPWPQTVQVTAGSLRTVASHADQLLRQLAHRAEALADEPGLYCDDIGPAVPAGPGVLALRAGAELLSALPGFDAVHGPLQRAGEALNRLGISDDPWWKKTTPSG